MAFQYNGTSPTTIKYNGTDLTVLKYGTTSVWGKPYSLSISAGSNTSVSVERTSSPNQHSSTGKLSSGSVVYYGDVLKITASASSGYKLSTFTVNGTSFTSGNTITVSSAINVVTTAEASATWKTVWTGENTIPSTYNGKDTIFTYTQSGFSGLKTGYPTRITGHFYWYEEYSWNNETINFTIELGQYIYQNTLETSGNVNDFSITTTYPPTNYCFVGVFSISPTSLGWRMRTGYYSGGAYYYYIGGRKTIFVTKIEQYY